MKSLLCVALFSLSLTPSYSQEGEKGKVSFEELSESLASDDFKIRTEATTILWEMGDVALDFLAALEGHDDPELAVRAGVLRKKIRLGIQPDTPPEIVEKLERYFESDVGDKERIIRELYNEKRLEILVRLRAIEKDEEILETLTARVDRLIPQAIRQHLIAGEMEEARVFLKLGNGFESLISYGNFLQVHGELEEAIRALEKSTDPELQQRYLAYLRVKGDAELLKKEAARLGDENAHAAASLVLGDSVPLLKLYEKKETGPLDGGLLASLILARREGDQEKITRLVKSLTELSQKADTAGRARLNLYRAGLVELAHESAEKSGWEALTEHLRITDQNRKIPAVLGISEGKVTQEWLDKLLLRVKTELEGKNSAGEALSLLRHAMFFYESRGEIETSAKIFSGFLSIYGEREKKSFPDLVSSMRYNAPRSGMIALGKETGKNSLSLEEILKNDFASPFLWLAKKIKELEPDFSKGDVIDLLDSFIYSPSIPFADLEEWQERLEAASLVDLKKGDVSSLKNFYQLQLYIGSASERWRLLALPSLAKSYPYPRALLATQLGKWEEATEIYAKQSPDLATVYPHFLSQKGLALAKGGKQAEADELLKLASLLGRGSSESLTLLASQYREYQEYEKSDALLKSAFLRSEKGIFGSVTGAGSLTATLGENALNSGKWEEAALFLEAALLSPSASNSGFALVTRFKIETCRGLIALDEGRRAEGLQILEAAHRMIPASGMLADQFFPMIRERGLTEFHDRLCHETLDLLRQDIAAFPKEHSAKNTFGWVASRANRSLVEAEEMMVSALKGSPFSAPFLDTMAEVKFAMRKREEAIFWSEKSVDFGINDPLIRAQLRRFRQDPFPAE